MQFSDLIRHDKPVLTDAVAMYPFSRKMEREYRFTSRFDEEVLLHKVSVDGKWIALPRALCPVGEIDGRVIGKPVKFPKCPAPRDYQAQLFKETVDFLKQGQSGVVSAYTGWGKTVLGYKAAYEIQRKTLVITTKDDIYEQWIDGAIKILGLPPYRVGEVRGDKCEIKGADFVVAMIHSLTKEDKYPDWIGDDFGLVIFDEVHRLPADTFIRAAMMFPAMLRLGLSATVDRADGKEQLIYAHIGPIRAKTQAQLMKPKILRYQTGWECPKTIRSLPHGEKKVVKIPHEPGKTAHIERIMSRNMARNVMMGREILQAYKKGRRIVCFTTRIDHIAIMHKVMLELGVHGKDMGHYAQASTKAEKEAREKVKAKPIIWTTYNMMAEGTDIPWLDTCALLMPRSDVKQAVGRVRREYEDKAFPAVLDFIDADSPVFYGYSRKRHDFYKSIGCVVVEMS